MRCPNHPDAPMRGIDKLAHDLMDGLPPGSSVSRGGVTFTRLPGDDERPGLDRATLAVALALVGVVLGAAGIMLALYAVSSS